MYLVQDTATSSLYALKKIRCPFGRESVAQALKEVEAYSLFAPHPYIIHAIDHSVVSSNDRSDPGAKTVYILLPYFRRGNLQDAINANLVNHSKFPERRLMILFLGVAQAMKAMHQYRVKGPPGGSKSQGKAKAIREEAAAEDADAARKAQKRRQQRPEVPDDPEETEHQPLMEGEVAMSQEGVGDGDLRPYAHRDIKPGTYTSRLVRGHSKRKLTNTTLNRQHHDIRHRHSSNTNGLGLSRPFSYAHNKPLPGPRRPRYRSRTFHNAVPSARTL